MPADVRPGGLPTMPEPTRHPCLRRGCGRPPLGFTPVPVPAAVVVLAGRVLNALAGLATATPTVEQLAASLGTPAEALTPTLEAAELVEAWRDGHPRGSCRVMLSSVAAGRLGLAPAPGGEYWREAASTVGPGAGRRESV